MTRFILLAFLILSASEVQAFRCGTKLVRPGDHFAQVLQKCGDPAHQEKWVENQVMYVRPHPLLRPERTVGGVLVQLWTYNQGKRRFMRQLRFENGILQKVDTLGRGY